MLNALFKSAKNFTCRLIFKSRKPSYGFFRLKRRQGVGLSQDNALLFAWALSNKGFKVGVGEALTL
ncbi:MAG: hypothetical protein LBF13_03165 [Campylobacteraceae bacterium]|jgi:hypothetical protein|nr:hypothetical protein [Campylobacteraceae bacterium]